MIASVIASQTLIGQEADPRITGSTLGAFNFFGGLGTIFATVARRLPVRHLDLGRSVPDDGLR